MKPPHRQIEINMRTRRTSKSTYVVAGLLTLSLGAAMQFVLPGTTARAAVLASLSGLFGKKPTINNPGLKLGAYDPHGDFKDDRGVAIEHLFIPWEDVELTSLNEADAYALARHRTLQITVEPWSWDEDKRVSAAELKNGILSGFYDPNIAAVCGTVGQLKSEVTVRWGHEMETNLGRFIWAGWAPKDYIAAYRHFVDRCRVLAPSAKFMWSPRGDKNLVDYYPGDAYADVIGLSVFALQRRDHDLVGRDRTFDELFAPSYKLVARFNKPVVVAELGYVGDDPYKTQFADSVTKIDPRFPQLTSVVYFNDKEVFPWPDGYGLPNWRVVPEMTN
jgi:beta-mannanase